MIYGRPVPKRRPENDRVNGQRRSRLELESHPLERMDFNQWRSFMDYKKVLRLHYVNGLSSRDIAESCGCGKTSVNEFLKRFRECGQLTYPLPEDVSNEFIENMLYRKPGVSSGSEYYRSFDEETVYKALTRKGVTLKKLWNKYNAIGVVDGLRPLSYRQYCRRYAAWCDSKKITFHIQRYPGINLELDYAGKTLLIHDRRNPELTTDVTIFIAALSYSDYFYCEGMVECDIRNWIRVNNNALDYFGGVTQIITSDNCKVAVTRNRDWVDPLLNKDFQAWAEHNHTVLQPAKVKSPRWKPMVEGHVKIVTMHILVDMDEMTFYSLEELNKYLWQRMDEENQLHFSGLDYSRWDLFNNEEKDSLLPLPSTKYEYLERQTVKVSQDFSFIFDKVHYTMPRKYLKQELDIRASETEIFVYNRNGDLVRTHKRSYTPKSWVVIPSDMPKEYKNYGYWTVPYFLQRAADVGPQTRILMDNVIKKFEHPVQSFRSCFGILKLADKHGKTALENCCRDAVLAGKCSYTYVANTIASYDEEPEPTGNYPSRLKSVDDRSVTGTFKDDDSRYSIENLLRRQNEGGAR